MQSQELHVPPSPSECDGQDSGGDFDFKLDGDDDGFIDDFVQEQSKEVHNHDDNLAVDFPHGGSSCPLHQIRIWNVSFCGGRKIRGCGEKPSEPGQEPTMRCQVLQSNPGHSRGRQALLSQEALIISLMTSYVFKLNLSYCQSLLRLRFKEQVLRGLQCTF